MSWSRMLGSSGRGWSRVGAVDHCTGWTQLLGQRQAACPRRSRQSGSKWTGTHRVHVVGGQTVHTPRVVSAGARPVAWVAIDLLPGQSPEDVAGHASRSPTSSVCPGFGLSRWAAPVSDWNCRPRKTARPGWTIRRAVGGPGGLSGRGFTTITVDAAHRTHLVG